MRSGYFRRVPTDRVIRTTKHAVQLADGVGQACSYASSPGVVRRLAWHHITQVPGGPGSETITAKTIMENIVAQRPDRRPAVVDRVVAKDRHRCQGPRRTKRQALSKLTGPHTAAGASISTDVIAAGCS